MMTESELRSLISRSQENGFNALFQQYKGYVYTIVWERIGGIGSREDAEECVSDIFMDIFLCYNDIHEGTLQGYIGTVARRRAINMFHKLTAKNTAVPLDDEKVFYISSEENVETDHEQHELHRLLFDKIKSLGEPDATMLIMKYYYDCKSDEIAKAVHLNPITVRVRVSRALKRLQRMVSDEKIL